MTPETERATVGDTVTLAFRVRLDERDLLFDTVPKPARTLPDWIRVFGVEKLQRQPDRIYVGKARIAFYRPGRQAVPLFELPFMRSVKGLSRGTLTSDSATVEVVPVLSAGSSATLRDIKEPASAGKPEPLALALGLLALAVAGWLTWRARRRGPAAVAEPLPAPAAAPAARDPYDIAADRLVAIERERWSARDVARHYAEVTDALRDYLEAARRPGARADDVGAPLVAAAGAARGARAPAVRRGVRRGGSGEVRAPPSDRRATRPRSPGRAGAARGVARRARARSGRRRGDPCDSLIRSGCCCCWYRRPSPGPGGAAGGARRTSGSAFPGLAFLAGAPVSRRSRWPWLPDGLRLLGLALLIVALARPQVPHEVRQIRSKARNIMIALDISSSMKAGDFKPGNRLHGGAPGARRVHPRARGRPPRPGHLRRPRVPAGAAHARHRPAPADARPDRHRHAPDGTAIGTALTMCLAQLKDLPSKASVVVLITDGANNTGKPSPLVAAEAARAIGVRIHTIGVSAADTTAPDKQFIWRWGGRTPDRLSRGDEAILQRISERSGGKYFRATDPEALEHILQAIDPIERQEVKISETRDYRELYLYALAPGLVLLAAGVLLGATRLRSLP